MNKELAGAQHLTWQQAMALNPKAMIEYHDNLSDDCDDEDFRQECQRSTTSQVFAHNYMKSFRFGLLGSTLVSWHGAQEGAMYYDDEDGWQPL